MKTLLFLLIGYCFVGCSIEKEGHILLHSNIDLNENHIGLGGYITTYNNDIIGIEQAGSLSPFYQITTKNDINTINYFGVRGQGPEDFIQPIFIQHLSDSVFGVHDAGIGVYKEICISTATNSISTLNAINMTQDLFRAIKVSDNHYIGLSNTTGMLVSTDSTGKRVETHFEYPYKNKREQSIKNNIRSMAYQGLLEVNPQKTKCVYASFNGDIIHFYDLHDDISPIRKIEKNYPKYRPEEFNDGYAALLDPNNIVGYISVTTTDKFIYALYCGKKIEKLITNNSISKEGNILRIFDWTGKLINTCTLDVACKHISVSDDDKILWALAVNPEIVPVYFKLHNN